MKYFYPSLDQLTTVMLRSRILSKPVLDEMIRQKNEAEREDATELSQEWCPFDPVNLVVSGDRYIDQCYRQAQDLDWLW